MNIDQVIGWYNKGLISLQEYNYFSDKIFQSNLQKIREIKASIQKDIRTITEEIYSMEDQVIKDKEQLQKYV